MQSMSGTKTFMNHYRINVFVIAAVFIVAGAGCGQRNASLSAAQSTDVAGRGSEVVPAELTTQSSSDQAPVGSVKVLSPVDSTGFKIGDVLPADNTMPSMPPPPYSLNDPPIWVTVVDEKAVVVGYTVQQPTNELDRLAGGQLTSTSAIFDESGTRVIGKLTDRGPVLFAVSTEP